MEGYWTCLTDPWDEEGTGPGEINANDMNPDPFTLVRQPIQNGCSHSGYVTAPEISTEFGDRIVFMPKIRWFAFFSSHPVVGELRRLAGMD